MPKARVLFLCTHNSARSQMAEGLLRHAAGDRFEVHSAGTEATRVRPLAIQDMRELGIDISTQTSTALGPFVDQQFDYVITVCDEANESCPIFPNAVHRLHWSLRDPSTASGTAGQQPRSTERSARSSAGGSRRSSSPRSGQSWPEPTEISPSITGHVRASPAGQSWSAQ
jgi:arsenate reductase